jgi:3-hydroxyacyl-[acyl-carrier-protein] dehydratase
MRWMWIDRILEFEPGERAVSIKAVSLSEEHMHDHLPACPRRGLHTLPIMPASLVIEGMAQTAGILVGCTLGFREKVVLAKVSLAELLTDALPGDTIRHETTIERLDETGASTRGVVRIIRPTRAGAETIPLGRIDLMFAFVDRNRAGLRFPEHNFVLTDAFVTLLRTSGFPVPDSKLNEASRDLVVPQRLPRQQVAP